MEYKKQHSLGNTSDSDEEFLHSLLPDMKTMNAKLKHIFKIGVVKMIDEILYNTESEGRSSIGLAETFNIYDEFPESRREISLLF
jgi:hypothetical protein